MTNLTIKSGYVNDFKFEIELTGAKKKDPYVRLAFIQDDRSLLFPAKVENGMATITVDNTNGDIDSSKGYALEVLVGNNLFTPLEGGVVVEEKIAACVNIIPDIVSIFEWKGNVEEEDEYLLIIKTNEDKSEKIIQRINEIHSYDTPECIGFKIEKGSDKYLNWISDVLK